MPESGIDNTEEILKRLLVNIGAFKRLERDNKKLEELLLKNEAAKRSEYKRQAQIEAIEAGKREVATKKVAKEIIEKLRKGNDILIKELSLERRRNSFLTKKYSELLSISKKMNYDNKIMKAVLTRDNAQKNKLEQKMFDITKKLEEKHELTKTSYKSLLKEHELTKIDVQKKLAIEQEKFEFLEKKYLGLVEGFSRATKDYNKARKMNEVLIKKLEMMYKQSLANEKVLNARTEMIKGFFENKLKEMAKLQINKEIDYKARIESMSTDLAKYYDELKESKKKYFEREKEIREKIKEIIG